MAPASRTRAVDFDEVIVLDLQLLAKMVHPFFYIDPKYINIKVNYFYIYFFNNTRGYTPFS